MSPVNHTVLIVSADADLLAAAEAALASESGYRILACTTEQEAAARLDEAEVHMVIADDRVLSDGADNLLNQSRISHPGVARVLVVDADDEVRAAELAQRTAAYLYLARPAQPALLRLVAKRALELTELSRRHRLLSRELKISMDDDIFSDSTEFAVKGVWSQFEKLVYVSPKMAELSTEARQAAKTDLPVLIAGETGTGKELLARAIHYNSTRMGSPMHVQNCGGVSDETLLSELFGHVRGAFTGAISDRLGLFRAADGGTVFLDEISEVSPSFQVSLLRFLQEGEVKPLGSDRVHHAKVRIIAASNRSLQRMVERGEFRRDLFYRLKGFELHIPPLRERREDIAPLCQFFIEKYSGVVGRRVVGITQDALAKLQAYSFPGNVRELETEVRRMVAIAEQGGYLASRHLSSDIAKMSTSVAETPSFAVPGETLKSMVENLEIHVVSECLRSNQWNQRKAADQLGLSRVGLANKIKRYGLNNQ